MSFISIYTDSFTLFCKEPITSLLLPHNKMSRLYHLDSSSSSDDDDEPELTLGALHQAHTRYLAMHSSQWGGSVPGRQYIHRDRESGHWRLYHDYFSEAPTYDADIFQRGCGEIDLFSSPSSSISMKLLHISYSSFFDSGLEWLVLYFFASPML